MVGDLATRKYGLGCINHNEAPRSLRRGIKAEVGLFPVLRQPRNRLRGISS